MDEESSDGDASTNTTVIAYTGDLIIKAVDESSNASFMYRVESATLAARSAYFNRLLDPTKFVEGVDVAKKLATLRRAYGKASSAPISELPVVKVLDVGRTSKVSSIKLLFGDFLKILHGHDILAAKSSPGALPMPIQNVANLAVVADRFDALAFTSAYVHRKRIIEHIDARSKAKAPRPNEERQRQKFLIGLLFNHAPWVAACSQALIITGSARWKPSATEDLDLPSWWDLPQGLEGTPNCTLLLGPIQAYYISTPTKSPLF